MGLPPESRIPNPESYLSGHSRTSRDTVVPLGTQSYLSGHSRTSRDTAPRISTLQTIEYQYARSQRQLLDGDRQNCELRHKIFKSCMIIYIKLVSSYSLMTCHCAECETGRNL